MARAQKRPIRTAAVYCRISKDDSGEGLGVERQRRDCNRYAERLGWSVVNEFVDNDVSASRYALRARPEFAKLLDSARTGGIDALVVWSLDRLSRQPKELEALIDIAESGVEVHTVGGHLDLSTAEGRLVARILVAAAASESDQASKRIRRQKEARAELGLNHGGGRAFGFDRDGITIRNDEAALVREMAARLLSGETLNGVARWLNDLGVPLPQGGRAWTARTVKVILTNPRIAGLRASRGEVVGKAAWDAVVDELTWRRLCRHFSTPNAGQQPKRRTLLTGLVACGRCEAPLYRRWRSGAPLLACHRAPGRPGCGRVSVSAAPVEQLVVEAVLAAADGAALARRRRALKTTGAPEEKMLKELSELATRTTELADMFAAGEIGRAEWLSARAGLESRRRPLEGQLAQRTDAALLSRYAAAPGALRAAWPDLTVDQRRAVIAAVIARITIQPTVCRGPKFDVDRVEVEWRA